MRLTVGSVFAGIGGFDEGFRRAGFVIQWHCEIEPWCRRTLERHFPDAVCFSDVAEIGSGATVVERAQRIKARTWPEAITSSKALQRARAGIIRDDLRVDVLVGGFPCQDVSVAGQRTGLSGKRSGLYFEFMRLVRELQPRWVVIENVPGLLSSQRGRDFHAVLAEMAQCRLRRAYRILDSQYFGVPQRRRRVFLVGRAGDGGAEQILLEPDRLHRCAQTDRETGPRVASTLRSRSAKRGVNEPGRGGEDDVNLIYFDWQSGGDVRHTYSSSSSSSSLQASQTPAVIFLRSGNGNITGGVPFTVAGERARTLVASMHKRHDDDTDTLIPTLDCSLGHHRVGDFCVASPVTASAGHHGHSSPRGDGRDNLVAATLLALNRTTDLNGNFQPTASGVRRLTPLECERLQGFPDGWTCLCGEGHKGSRFCTCPDTPRYKALGNAITVNVAEWVAKRLKEAESSRNGTRE